MTYVAGPDIRRSLRIKLRAAEREYADAVRLRERDLFSHATTSKAGKALAKVEKIRRALANA